MPDDSFRLVLLYTPNKLHIGKLFYRLARFKPGYLIKNKIKAYGQLVLLGFDVTTFTPVAYQRHRL